VRVTDTAVAVLVRVTVAPGTTPPEESRTVPTTEAVSNCAEARAAKTLNRSAMKNVRRRTAAGMVTSDGLSKRENES
jgi:hypothetical protein